jgi:hypothetical protein
MVLVFQYMVQHDWRALQHSGRVRSAHTLTITSTAVETKQLCMNSVNVLVYYLFVTIEGDHDCTTVGKVGGCGWVCVAMHGPCQGESVRDLRQLLAH